MKKIEIIKRTFLTFSGILLISLFTFCGNEDEKIEENDTIKEIETVKKSREELIVLRDTMKIANPDSITDFEYKHTPEIILGELNDEGLTAVEVKVGSNGIVHPSEEGHWIDFLAVYVDDNEIERREAENGAGSNEAVFMVDLTGAKELKVVAGCNLHGIWINSISVE